MEVHLLKCAEVLGAAHVDVNRLRALWDVYQKMSSAEKQVLTDVGIIEHIATACREVNACAATRNRGMLVLKLQRLSFVLTYANGLLT